jgi:hypothetical protein
LGKLLDCGANKQLCDDGVTPAVCVNVSEPSCSDAVKNQDETERRLRRIEMRPVRRRPGLPRER